MSSCATTTVEKLTILISRDGQGASGPGVLWSRERTHPGAARPLAPATTVAALPLRGGNSSSELASLGELAITSRRLSSQLARQVCMFGYEFYIDPSRCIGCEACINACAECETHRGHPMITVDFLNRQDSIATVPMVCMLHAANTDLAGSRHDGGREGWCTSEPGANQNPDVPGKHGQAGQHQKLGELAAINASTRSTNRYRHRQAPKITAEMRQAGRAVS